jgi:hypothetical protein
MTKQEIKKIRKQRDELTKLLSDDGKLLAQVITLLDLDRILTAEGE